MTFRPIHRTTVPAQSSVVVLQRLTGPFRVLNRTLAKYLGERGGYHFVQLINSPSTNYPPGTVLNVPLETLGREETSSWPIARKKLHSSHNA